MRPEDARVSLADLSAVGLRLRPAEAVTVVRELIAQVLRGIVPGVPSAHVIRLSRTGQVTVEGPVAAGRAVSRAATLLDSLLPPFDAPAEARAPGALRLVVARALGTLDLPAYGSLEAFSDALDRFAEPDAAETVRRLVGAWATAADRAAASAARESLDAGAAPQAPDPARAAAALVRLDPATVTVSDIRRARRATGLPLVEIASRSRIPVPLLRQLEWGYLHNWPAGHDGRTHIVRYARASGLDEDIVLAAIRPLLEQAIPARAEAAATREVPADGDVAVVPTPITQAELRLPDDLPLRDVDPAAPAVRGGRSRWRVAAAAAVVAAAATLAALVFQDSSIPGDAGALAGYLQGAVERLPVPIIPPAPAVSDGVGDAGGGLPEAGTPVELPDAPAAASSESKPVPTAGRPAADARPAVERVSDDETAWSSALASEGSAAFQDPEGAALTPASGESGAILRITRVVDDGAHNYHARLSPDGSRIAFDSDRDGERGVYVADADGANVRRVSGEGFAAIPSWAPDGRRLAFVRAEADRPRVWNLWLVDLESGDLRRLTSHREGQPWGASWFPDGRRLAYSRGEQLAVLDVASGRERVIPSPRRGRAVRTPAVSPDGRRMIVQVEGDGAWLLDLADESARKVLSDPTADEYVWSPDGRRVAYHSRSSGEWGVWLMVSRQ